MSNFISSFKRIAADLTSSGGWKRFYEKFGANLAGYSWNTGNVLQLGLGAVTLSPLEMAAGATNIAASSSSMLFGHTKFGVPVMGVLGFLGGLLTYYPGLAQKDIVTWGSFLFLSGIQVLNFANEKLAQKFGRSARSLLRETLGNPRRLSGGIALASHLAIVANSLCAQNYKLAICSACWSLGDALYAISKPVVVREMAQAKGPASTPAP